MFLVFSSDGFDLEASCLPLLSRSILNFLVQVRSLLARLTCLSVLMNHPSKLSCRLMVRKEDNRSKFEQINNQTNFSQNDLFEKHGFQNVGSFSLTNPVPWHSLLKSGGTLEQLTYY